MKGSEKGQLLVLVGAFMIAYIFTAIIVGWREFCVLQSVLARGCLHIKRAFNRRILRKDSDPEYSAATSLGADDSSDIYDPEAPESRSGGPRSAAGAPEPTSSHSRSKRGEFTCAYTYRAHPGGKKKRAGDGASPKLEAQANSPKGASGRPVIRTPTTPAGGRVLAQALQKPAAEEGGISVGMSESDGSAWPDAPLREVPLSEDSESDYMASTPRNKRAVRQKIASALC